MKTIYSLFILHKECKKRRNDLQKKCKRIKKKKKMENKKSVFTNKCRIRYIEGIKIPFR